MALELECGGIEEDVVDAVKGVLPHLVRLGAERSSHFVRRHLRASAESETAAATKGKGRN